MHGGIDTRGKAAANARHLASTLVADARFCVAVGKLMQVVDVGRHLSSQGLDSPNLLRRAEAKVLEGKAVIKAWFLFLHFLQNIQR